MFAWTNYECVFNTENTRNDFGNSTYYVWLDRVLRNAPINQEKHPSMMNDKKKYIAYLEPDSPLARAIARRRLYIKTGQENPLAKLVYASFDHVYLAVHFDSEPSVEGVAHREPKIGWQPCDFQWSQSRGIRRIHVGHQILYLSHDRPSILKPEHFEKNHKYA